MFAGCTLGEEPGLDIDPAVTSEDELDGGCPPEACGLNGTVLAETRLGELSLDGVPSDRGVAIVDVVDRHDNHLALDIADSAFVGVEHGTGAVTDRGAELVGSRIILHKELGQGVTIEWELVIEDMAEVAFMSDEHGAIPTYHMTYAPASDPTNRRPVCADSAPLALIKGERYDARTLAIHTRGSERWFRLACQDQLLWKTKRMSYDPERSTDHTYHTTAGQRRATLAMLAADYCGSGQRFTTPGTAVYWQNRAGWMLTGASPDRDAAVEAGWDEHGATCLGTPRHEDTYGRADIEAACGHAIPACTPEILAASEWITWVP